MKYTEEISNKLNELLEKNYDAEAGYKSAAENVESTNLKSFFQERAQDRYSFGQDLKAEIKSYGKEPDKGTSWKGDAHRTWMNLKSTFSSNNEKAILEEAIKGEKAALKEYNKIIDEEVLEPSTQKVLEKHRDNVFNALENIKAKEKVN